MRRGLPRPTPSAVAVVLQVASLLVVASGLVVMRHGESRTAGLRQHDALLGRINPSSR